MEEELQKIIKILCQDFEWKELNQSTFNSICKKVTFSVYGEKYLINEKADFLTDIDENKMYIVVGHIYEFKIVGRNPFAERVITKFMFSIDKDYRVNVTISDIKI